jgi:hypothetical protein
VEDPSIALQLSIQPMSYQLARITNPWIGQSAPANSCGPLKSPMIEGNPLTAPWL